MASGSAVRELVNKVTFKLDQASVNRVNTAIDRLKRDLDRVGNGFQTSMMRAMENTRRSIDKTSLSIRRLRQQMSGLQNGRSFGGANSTNGSRNIGGSIGGSSRMSVGSMTVRAGSVTLHGFRMPNTAQNAAARSLSVNSMSVNAATVNLHGNHIGGANGSNLNNGGGRSERLADRGGDFASRGATMATAGAAMLAPIGWAVKKAADFEEASSKVQALTTLGKSADEAKRIKTSLENKAKEMGESTRFSATQSMGAMEKMAMAGWDEKQIVAGINPMLNLAVAGSTDIVTTSDIVTDGMTALHMGADETARFADAMAVAAAKSNTNVQMMGETFKYAAAPAGALGYTIEDLALATGLMANAGIKDSMAGTALRSTFTRLSTGTREAEAAMNVLGISLTDSEGKIKPLRQTIEELRAAFKSVDPEQIIKATEAMDGMSMAKDKKAKMLEILQKMQANDGALSATDKIQFAKMLSGQEAMSGFLAMATADDESYHKLADPLQNTNGAAAQMAAITGANTKGAAVSAESAMEGLGIAVGDLLLPALTELLQVVTPIIRTMSEWVKENPKIAATILGIVTAVGSLLAVLGTIGVFVGGIMGLAGAFGGIGAVISGVIAAVQGVIATVGAAIAAIGAPVIATVLAVIAVVALLIAYWDEVKAAVGTALNYAGQMFMWLLGIASEFFAAVAAFFGSLIQQIFSTAGTLISAFGSAISAVKGFFSDLYGHAMGILSEIASAISGWIGEKIAWARDALSSLGSFAANVVGGIGDTVSTAYNSLQNNTFNLSSDSQLGSAMGAANSWSPYS